MLPRFLAIPASFALQVLRAFRANQGLLLAAALAYYLLLSIVPLLILILWALSRIIDRQHLLATLGANLERIVPGQSALLLDEHRPRDACQSSGSVQSF